MHVLFCKCYDLGRFEVRNCIKVISKYLQIYMLVRFGKGAYTCWFGSSKQRMQKKACCSRMTDLSDQYYCFVVVLLLFVNDVFLDLKVELNV